MAACRLTQELHNVRGFSQDQCLRVEPAPCLQALCTTPAKNAGCTRSIRISHSVYCIVPTSCAFYHMIPALLITRLISPVCVACGCVAAVRIAIRPCQIHSMYIWRSLRACERSRHGSARGRCSCAQVEAGTPLPLTFPLSLSLSVRHTRYTYDESDREGCVGTTFPLKLRNVSFNLRSVSFRGIPLHTGDK
jgi:hypothetical protein